MRMTAMEARGELNVGSRAAALRQRVSPRRIQHVRRARHRGVRLGRASRAQARTSGTPGSYEALLHDVQVPAFWLMTADRAVRDTLRVPRLERFIGVIYRPETERQSHYFHARLADQFDAVIHLDRTRPRAARAHCALGLR